MYKRREANDSDECATGTCVEAENELVEHVPLELSFLVHTFLRPPKIKQGVCQSDKTKKTRKQNCCPGIISGKNTQSRHRKKFEKEVLRMKQLCSHTDILVQTLRKISMVLENRESIKRNLVKR